MAQDTKDANEEKALRAGADALEFLDTFKYAYQDILGEMPPSTDYDFASEVLLSEIEAKIKQWERD